MSQREERAARLLHHRSAGLQAGDPIALPLVQSSAFHLPQTTQAPYVYGRFSNPTWSAVEAQLEIWEGGPCLAFPSGMAAITAGFHAVLKAGDRMLIPADGYYAGRVLATKFMTKFGVEVVTCPTTEFATVPLDGVNLVLVETPSNPMLEVVDLQALSARTKAEGACLMVDNTTATACLQRPLELGADLVVAADTKAAAGHSDLLFGHVAGLDAGLMQTVHDWRTFSGSIPGPAEAWLTHRGLETMEVRLERMCTSALVIATRLQDHPSVRRVRYPGLPDDPSHEIASRQMDGFGQLLSLTLDSRERAEAFISGCDFLVESTSFGGVHSSAECRVRWGDDVAPGFVRLSVGLEPTEVLWEAIAGALDEARDVA